MDGCIGAYFRKILNCVINTRSNLPSGLEVISRNYETFLTGVTINYVWMLLAERCDRIAAFGHCHVICDASVLCQNG